MNYKELLERSFVRLNSDTFLCPNGEKSRLEFVNDAVFDFTNYDTEFDIIFAVKAVEVAKVITERKTFQYIEDRTNYGWYLIMTNMPFFRSILNWGSSIRGAWWCPPHGKKKISLHSCYLFDDDGEQILDMEFTVDEWKLFMEAIFDFVSEEMKLCEVKGFNLSEKTPEVPQ